MRGLGRGSGTRGVRLAEFGFFVTAALVGVILLTRPAPAQTYNVPTGSTQIVSTPITDGATPDSVIKNEGGTLVFTAANTYTGTTTIAGGTLAADNTGAVADSSALTLTASGATLDISNAGGATPVLSLSGVGGSTVYLGANQLTVGNPGGVSTFAGMIEGTGSLYEAPTGSLTLRGTNTYTGATEITSGTLSIGSGGSIAMSSGVDIVSGGTFDISTAGNQTIGDLAGASGSVTLGANTLTLGTGDSTSFGGVISGTGGVTKQGAGTLTLGGDNNFGGTLTIDGGTVAIGATGSMASASLNLATAGTTFDVSAASNPVIQDLSGVAGTAVSLGANTLTFGTGNSTIFGGVITGAGGLFKEGTGTITLTGANTFSGGVFIDDGTLALGAGGSMVSATSVFVNGGSAGFSIANAGNQTVQNLTAIGGGAVMLGANTLTVDNTGGSGNLFAGVFSGTGGIVVEGDGTLTINAPSTYTGSTVVNGGTLALGSTGSIASSSGLNLAAAGTAFDISGGTNQTIQGLSGVAGTTVNLGPFTLTVGGTGSTIFAGTIAGITPLNGLTKQGSGTLTLTGVETYIGPTTINAGTLALGAGGSLAASSGISLAASSAAFDISGGGSQVIQDLTGVSGSAITLGANTLTLGTANSTSFAGNISGAGGALAKQGTGTLTLSGTDSYTGGTTITAGTLTGTTSSLQGNILDNAALVFNQSAAGTYAGSLSGSGTLSLQGTGVVTLTGNSAGFAGTTNVSSGDLAVGASSSSTAQLGGNVGVTSGGMVSGHGTIGGSLTNTSGAVAPGGSIGTLTVNGNYTQGPTGTLAVQLTPAGASKLAVAGTVSLQGSLDILSGPNGYVPFSQYTILTSGGGISGTFQSVTGSLPVIPLSVEYQTNQIYLQLGGFTGLTPDETAVANILDSQIANASGDFLNMLNLAVLLPAQQMQQALSSLGGQIYGNLGEVTLQDRRIFLEALTDRTRTLGGAWPASSFGGIQSAWGGSDNALKFAQLGNALSAHDQQIMSDVNSYASPPSGAVGGFWARGFGQFGTLDGNSGALGSSYATGGGIIGADVISNPHAVLGLAASGGQSSVSLSTNPETGTISFFQGGLYGARELDNGLVFDGTAIYAHDIYDVSRGIVLPGVSRSASSTHGGDDEVGELGVGRTFFYDDLRVLPRAEVSYYHIGQSGFSETGASSLDLSVSPADLDALYSRVGVTLVKPIVLGSTALVPELRVAWLHNFLKNYGQFDATFAGAPTASFTQFGAPMGRDAADLGAGLSFGIAHMSFGGELSGFVQYEAWLAAHELANAVGAGVRLNW
jgi:autotransporter-associated beta strand protein